MYVTAHGVALDRATIKDSDGEVVAVYKRKDVQAALEKKGACETDSVRAARLKAEAADPSKVVKLTKQQEAAQKQQKEREERQQRCDTITQERVIRYRKIRARAAAGLTLPMLRELTKALVLDSQDHSLPDDLIGDLYPFQDRGDVGLCAYIDQADITTVQLLLMDLIVGENLSMSTWDLDDEPRPTTLAMLAMAKAEGIDVTATDLAVASIDIEGLQNPEEVRDAIAANIDHLAAVAAHIIDKAPHHLGNVEAAANGLGYFYSTKGWQKKAAQEPAADKTAQGAIDDQPDIAPTPRKTITLKPKADAPAGEAAGPVIKLRKNRAAQAEASGELVPASAWPFPTQSKA